MKDHVSGVLKQASRFRHRERKDACLTAFTPITSYYEVRFPILLGTQKVTAYPRK